MTKCVARGAGGAGEFVFKNATLTVPPQEMTDCSVTDKNLGAGFKNFTPTKWTTAPLFPSEIFVPCLRYCKGLYYSQWYSRLQKP